MQKIKNFNESNYNKAVTKALENKDNAKMLKESLVAFAGHNTIEEIENYFGGNTRTIFYNNNIIPTHGGKQCDGPSICNDKSKCVINVDKCSTDCEGHWGICNIKGEGTYNITTTPEGLLNAEGGYAIDCPYKNNDRRQCTLGEGNYVPIDCEAALEPVTAKDVLDECIILSKPASYFLTNNS